MNHIQQRFVCSVCKRGFIVDVFSIGTEHQIIQAVTCVECAYKVKGNILDDKDKPQNEATN
jgi:DNA-directed RNA polymerase subunit RPC12/RpoP